MKTAANNGEALDVAERRLPARRDPARDINAPCWKPALRGDPRAAVVRNGSHFLTSNTCAFTLAGSGANVSST